VLERYPGWVPQKCRACRDAGPAPSAADAKRSAKRRTNARLSASATQSFTTAEVLERFTDGPQEGVFTDGSAVPNPGPGGWGVVWVRGGEIVAERHGHEPQTTNNRMELTAVSEALRLLPEDAEVTIHSDSELVVRTLNEWAPGWERAGWKRKAGPIKNLELVQEALALKRKRPRVKLEWIQAHAGSRWNEYADALASEWTRA
jgi:ribonuclease HI